MENMQLNQIDDNNITNLPLPELRAKWAEYWGMEPHARIGRRMLEKSLAFKIREANGEGLRPEQQQKLKQLVTSYKRNPNFFKENLSDLKPGIRLIKKYNNQTHSVTVLDNSFEYKNKTYGSLSEIAYTITGTRWNGWVFFGLKKRGGAR